MSAFSWQSLLMCPQPRSVENGRPGRLIDPNFDGRVCRLNAAFGGERDAIDALMFERVLSPDRDEKTPADGARDGSARER